MDRLLALSFPPLSSRNPLKIRKGLRQIDGLLAQICLSSSTSTASKRSSLALAAPPPQQTHSLNSHASLATLAHDPAYITFVKLQDHITYNITSHLLETLNALLSTKSHPASTTTPLIAQALEIILGLLLLHPPSRLLFQRRGNMDLLLDLLDPTGMPVEVLGATVRVLAAVMLGEPRGVRVFEEAGGVETVGSLLRAVERGGDGGGVARAVRQFLAFYLSAEAPSPSRSSAQGQGQAKMQPPPPFPASKHQSQSQPTTPSHTSADHQKVSQTIGSTSTSSSSSGSSSEASSALGALMQDAGAATRSVEEKRVLLGRCLGDGFVGELVGGFGGGRMVGVGGY